MTVLEYPRALELPGESRSRTHVLAAGVLGLTAAALSTWVVWRSGVLLYPHSNAAIRGSQMLALVAAGTFTWWRRPASRFGPLILGHVAVYALGSLNAFADPTLHLLGRLALAAFLIAELGVLLSFPYGELRGTLERRVFAAVGAATLAVWATLLLVAEHIPGGSLMTTCVGACPTNPLNVEPLSVFEGPLTHAARVVTVLSVCAVALVLLHRLRDAGGLPRRGYAPVLTAFVLLGCSSVVYTLWQPAAGPNARMLQLASATGLILISLALVVGQLRAHVIANWSLREMLGESGGSLDRLQDLLRDALGDPTLELAVWHPSVARHYTLGGEPFAFPSDPSHRVVRQLIHDETLLGLLAFDASLDDEAAVAKAVAAASQACHSRGEQIRELQESRRVAEAEAESRIRIERDLHDGALQRLLSLQMALAGLRRRMPTAELTAELAALEQQSRRLADDLRKLAHGIYPGTLLERGLVEALREATLPTSSRVRIDGNDVGRVPAHVEHAVYFCILEAVQNALRHAGAEARVNVTLRTHLQALEFTVVDDGAGFDAAATRDCGMGLVSMRDRIVAVRGSLDIDSTPGNGTGVRGIVPL